MGLLRLLLVGLVVYLGYRLVTTLSQRLPSPREPSSPPRTPPRTPPAGNRSPHEVLGVSPGASAEEIRAAYQKLIQQYHPDRVAGMGLELRELAEQRTKELNAAYDALKRS
jgi:DnaJ-domain-containing protein 1